VTSHNNSFAKMHTLPLPADPLRYYAALRIHFHGSENNKNTRWEPRVGSNFGEALFGGTYLVQGLNPRLSVRNLTAKIEAIVRSKDLKLVVLWLVI
jgi:hypothetical protein